MANPSVYANQATVVGAIMKMEIKSFDRKNPQPGQSPKFELLEMEVGAQGSKIKLSVMPTRKDPNKHRGYYDRFKIGQQVMAKGSLTEQVSEQGRIFRQIQAWSVDGAAESEPQKLVYYAAGHLGHPEKTMADAKEIIVVPLTIVNKYQVNGEDREREETLHIHPDEKTLEQLYSKVSPGRLIQVRGYIINKASFDEFGAPDGYASELTAAKIEVRDEAAAMWLPLGAITEATTQAPPVAGQVQGNKPVNDDDDVPF